MTTPDKKQRYDEATHQWVDQVTETPLLLPQADDVSPAGKTGGKKSTYQPTNSETKE